MRVYRTMTEQRGFTLPELLVACAIVAIVMAGVYGLLHTGSTGFVRGLAQVEAQEAARAALQRMSAELWASGDNPRGCPAVGGAPDLLTCFTTVTAISSANTTTFTIQSDVDGDGRVATTETNEIITYRLNTTASTNCAIGTCLERQASVTDASFQTVIAGVQTLTFTYFDQAGTTLATPVSNANLPNIRAVGIRIVTQPEVQASVNNNVRVAMNDLMRVRNR
jgi:prepilin-type N-terminal cleavage/methylation domain-containing protein